MSEQPTNDADDRAADESPADEPHRPTTEAPDDIPEGQAEPDRAEPFPGGPPTTPLDPPSAG